VRLTRQGPQNIIALFKWVRIVAIPLSPRPDTGVDGHCSKSSRFAPGVAFEKGQGANLEKGRGGCPIGCGPPTMRGIPFT
jgi:hypothetical protein